MWSSKTDSKVRNIANCSWLTPQFLHLHLFHTLYFKQYSPFIQDTLAMAGVRISNYGWLDQGYYKNDYKLEYYSR